MRIPEALVVDGSDVLWLNTMLGWRDRLALGSSVTPAGRLFFGDKLEGYAKQHRLEWERDSATTRVFNGLCKRAARRSNREVRRTPEAIGYVTQPEVNYRIRQFGRRCAYCNAPFEHIDHFIPLSRGGSGFVWNLVPACAECNCSKGDREPMEWCYERFGCVGFFWVRIATAEAT